MVSGEWAEVTNEAPCSICGKPDWCSISSDGTRLICRRKDNGAGIHKVDKSGQDYWLYKRNGHDGSSLSESITPRIHEVQKASPEALDKVYGTLVEELSLTPSHRQALNRRGLSEGEIKRRGYRTLTSDSREELAADIVERFGPEVCSRVPGFYKKGDDPAFWSLAGAPGLVIPVRDIERRRVALKVRADDAGDDRSRYTYISSSKHGAPGPGAQVHVPLCADPDQNIVRLTEGELKADVATVLTSTLTISIPGVAAWRQALPVLQALGYDTVRLAFDADAAGNEHVARALYSAFGALEEQGFEIELETWPLEKGKGIDDLLAAGHQPELQRGEKARKVVRRILAEAIGVSPILKNLKTAEELLNQEFPEVKWIVPGVLPEGATILAGKAKIGKSWLALDLGLAVASGGTVLGDKQVEEGEVLYLALEDNPRRLQSRLKKLLKDGKAPQNLELATDWPRLDEGGLEALESWLITHPNARLVIVDTLVRLREKVRDDSRKTLYQVDYEAVEPFLKLAGLYNVAVLVVHHLRKQGAEDPLDEISGSTGLTGGVDGALVLKKERGRADGYLYITGRDIEDEQELALNWDKDTATWKIVGDAEEYRGSKERKEIKETLTSLGGMAGPKEVSDALGKPYNNIKQLLFKMGNDGELRNVGGKYTVTDNLDNRDNLEEDSSSEDSSESLSDSEDPSRKSTLSKVTEVIDAAEITDEGAIPPLLTTPDQLKSLIEEIRKADVVAVDLETTGLNPRRDHTRLISIATAEGTWLFDTSLEVDLTPLFSALAQKRILLHKGQFDLAFLFAMGFELGEGGRILDTMLTSQLLEDVNNEGDKEAA